MAASVASCVTSNSGSRYISDSWFLLRLFLLLDCLVQFQSEGLSPVLLFLVLSCLVVVSWTPVLSKGKPRGSGSGGEERLKGDGRSGGRGNCGWNVLYERRIFFKKKK